MPGDENIPNSSSEAHPTPAGQYYLMEKIAQGGMAEIFKGLSYDVHGIKKTVCIKKILPNIAASQEFIDTLIDEAKIAVTLSHGNIAQVHDLGKVGEDYFMVMEFVEGKTLSRIMKTSRAKDELIPIPFACYFISEILNGLNYMHRRTDDHGRPLDIVHRDISPQNIMVSYSGTVKIIDFGIAKAKIKVGSTDSGVLKGKFAYMSPEQARGDDTDHRSDIFSLGVIFWELLTGQRLFKAENNKQTLRNVRKAHVKPPSMLREDLPLELDAILTRALAKDRDDRYAFASDMHDELVKFLYTTYPGFQPSDIVKYMNDLFADQLAEEGAQKEAGTPYLIIDHEHSALVDKERYEDTGIVRAPVDMQKYEIASEESPEEEVALAEEPAAPEVEEHAAEATIAKPKPKHPWRKYTALGAAILVAIAAVGFGIWHWTTRLPAVEKAPTSDPGQIIVTTTPPNAKVYLDGEFVGSGSPVTITDVESETKHLLTVEHEGFVAQTRRFMIKPNDLKDFAITLKPEVIPMSTLAISSTPAVATIFLDDEETKYRTPAVMPNVEPGKRHLLGLYLPGYKYWTTSFTTRPNETQNFHVQLARNYGALKISTEPAGALVMIDGSPSGSTPLVRDQLEPDTTHQVEVWLEGYNPVKQEVYIKAGSVEELHLSLEKGANTEVEPSAPETPAQEQPPASEATVPAPPPAQPAAEPKPMGPAM